MDNTGCQKVFVTGVSSGLGYGMAKAFLAQGSSVYGVSRRDPRESGATDLYDWSHFHFQTMDLRRFETLAFDLAGFLGAQVPDCVVLNAGVLSPIADMKDTSLHLLRDVMEINVYANKVVLDFFLASKNQPKHILAVSSGASLSGNRGWNAYSMSKAALNMLIQLYAQEMQDSHLISLAPGLIDTDMQEYLASLPQDERFAKIEAIKQKKGTPDMPGPVEAGELILAQWARIFSQASGSFLDIRKL